MKLLFLTNIPSPYRVDFFNELGKYCELTVAFEGKRAIDRDEKWIGAKSEHFKEIFLKGKRTSDASFFCPGVVNVIKQGFDQIIVSNYSDLTSIYAMTYMKHNHILYWIEADGGLIPNDESRIKYNIKKKLISSASYWFSSGKMTTEYFIHYGANKKRIYEYPFTSVKEEDILSVPLTIEKKQEIRKSLGIKEKNVVLSVGQFIYRKGFDVLLKAWGKCNKESSLYIIGGEPTDEYISLINELGLTNVYFEGFKSKSELKKYYEAADLFVMPTREDIWGLVINEAMAEGLPVITTDRCVAGKELIEEGKEGYIVPVDDSARLASKINKIILNDDLKKSMSFNSLNKIRNYTIEEMAKVHAMILTNMNH